MAEAKDITAKTAINLAQRAKKSYRFSRNTLFVPAALLMLLVLVKLNIADPWRLTQKTEAQALQQEALLQKTREALKDLAPLRETYEIEQQTQPALSGKVNVMDCFKLIEEELLPWAQVHSFTISEQQITVRLAGVTLNEMSGIYQRLMARELVDAVQIYNAAAGQKADKRATAAMTITLAVPGSREGQIAGGDADQAPTTAAGEDQKS